MPRKSLKNTDKSNVSKVEESFQNESKIEQSSLKENSSVDSEQNITLNKTENEENKIEFKINDIVWAKMKGYPFWPAKIVEIIYKKPLKESTPNPRRGKRSLNEPTEYKVSFFGDDSSGCVIKDNIKHYECEQKEDLKKKSDKNSKIKIAVEEAEKYLNGVKENDNAETNMNTEEKPLLSFDEELKLINNAIGTSIKQKKKSPKKSENEPENEDQKSSSNDLKENQQSSAKIDKSVTKKNQRTSALKAAISLTEASTPTQLKQQRKKVSKLSGEDLINYCSSAKKTYEYIKSTNLSIKKEKTTKKRNRSLSQDESDNKSLLTSVPESPTNSKKKRLERSLMSDDEEELNFRLGKNDKTNDIEENLRSGLSSPIDLSFEVESSTKFEFTTMTILIDSSQSLYTNSILKLIQISNESINKLDNDKNITIVLYDINEDDEQKQNDVKQAVDSKLNELNETNDKKQILIKHIDEFDNSILKNEIVFSFINSQKSPNNKKFQKFENILFSSDINGVKFVSFCPIDYENVMVYHHHFNDNNAVFIETPFIDLDNYSKIYIFCFDKKFFNSIKYFFDDFFGSTNVILIDDQAGFPSACCTSMQTFLPILKLNRILFDRLSSSVSDNLRVKCLPQEKQQKELEKIQNIMKNKIESETIELFRTLIRDEEIIKNKDELKSQLNKMIEEL